ncbi:MAG: hypothetical protein U7126_14415 [Microcoleus sp.]
MQSSNGSSKPSDIEIKSRSQPNKGGQNLHTPTKETGFFTESAPYNEIFS